MKRMVYEKTPPKRGFYLLFDPLERILGRGDRLDRALIDACAAVNALVGINHIFRAFLDRVVRADVFARTARHARITNLMSHESTLSQKCFLKVPSHTRAPITEAASFLQTKSRKKRGFPCPPGKRVLGPVAKAVKFLTTITLNPCPIPISDYI